MFHFAYFGCATWAWLRNAVTPLAKFRGCGCCAVAVSIQPSGPESGEKGPRMKSRMRDDVTRIYFHRDIILPGQPPEEKSLSRRFCNQTESMNHTSARLSHTFEGLPRWTTNEKHLIKNIHERRYHEEDLMSFFRYVVSFISWNAAGNFRSFFLFFSLFFFWNRAITFPVRSCI